MIASSIFLVIELSPSVKRLVIVWSYFLGTLIMYKSEIVGICPAQDKFSYKEVMDGANG